MSRSISHASSLAKGMTRPLMTLHHQPWPLSSAVASKLDQSDSIQEENTPYYRPDRFYPARIGQVLDGRYQIATKLGYGSGSTVWLARDLNRWRWLKERYVAIKINAIRHHSRENAAEEEIAILKRIGHTNPDHVGWHFVRRLTESFTIDGASGKHTCLVFEPLREPLWLYCRRFVGDVIPADILKIQLQMLLQGLDYLHSECKVIHTDLKPDNIMVKLEDMSILERDAKDEYSNPLPQKHTEDRTIYLSRNNYGRLLKPVGTVQITDFDLSVLGDVPRSGSIQAEIYRAPEVILGAGYSYAADIWNLGVMLWDLLEGKELFKPVQPDSLDEYDEHLHLGYITALLGPPPEELLQRGRRKHNFYRPDGSLIEPNIIPEDFSFETCINSMGGEEKLRFITFVKRMIRWLPEERSTAKELLEDPWLRRDFPQE